MEDFSVLPYDIIDNIGRRLPNIEDFVPFGATCKSWQLAATGIWEEAKEKHKKMSKKKRREIQKFFSGSPWMMLATYDHDQKFIRLSNKRVYNLELPQTLGRLCWGSRFGWMITVDINHNVRILNPLSRIQFSLPKLFTVGQQCAPYVRRLKRICSAEKIVISSAPSNEVDNSCIALAIAIQTDYYMPFVARLGDEVWTPVDARGQNYADAIFYQGYFFAVTTDGRLMRCDIQTSPPSARLVCSPPKHPPSMGTFYLVEMSGDLVLVERIYPDVQTYNIGRKTKGFHLYKLHLHRRWTELSDLGDNALFIGNYNTSFAIVTSEFPEFEIRRNCIYFSGQHSAMHGRGDYSQGIFDCDKKTMELFYEEANLFSKFSPSVFIVPSL
ncbi:SWR1-complex protein 3 [Ranunculus cassubicifolius]